MEGIMGQEEEGWNKVKPSKKKQNKVKWSKKRQKKLPLKRFQGNQLQQHPSLDLWKWTLKALQWHRRRQQSHQDSHYGYSSPGSHKEEKVFRR
jgi:hypothetical protein